MNGDYSKCAKHGTLYRLQSAERGKTIQVCDECEKEQRARFENIFRTPVIKESI